MNNAPVWRPVTLADLDAIMAIQDEVHSLLPERREIFIDKMHHCPEGCLALSSFEGCIGYGVAHPWRLGDVPPLDTPLGTLPSDANCLFIHDVALLPAARGRGAARDFIQRMKSLTLRQGWGVMALVSVYGTVPVWEKLGFIVAPDAVPPRKLIGYGTTARYMTDSVATTHL